MEQSEIRKCIFYITIFTTTSHTNKRRKLLVQADNSLIGLLLTV